MIRGEEIRVLIDYDLFDLNIKGEVGIYIKTDERSGKHMCYFSQNGEWAELPDDGIEQVRPGYISSLNQSFISRVKTLEYSLPT